MNWTNLARGQTISELNFGAFSMSLVMVVSSRFANLQPVEKHLNSSAEMLRGSPMAEPVLVPTHIGWVSIFLK